MNKHIDLEAIRLKKIIALKLKEELTERHLTQAEVAKIFKTSRSSVVRMLDPDDPAITLKTISRIANFLNCDIDLIFRGNSSGE